MRKMIKSLRAFFRRPDARASRRTMAREGSDIESELCKLIEEPAAPIEYLFVDRQRLVSYMEQIVGPQRQEKLPSWDVNFSIGGPKVTGTSSSHVRPHTDHEMIKELVSHLSSHGELPGTTFALGKMKARKAILHPGDNSAVPHLKQISVWVSEPDPEVIRDATWAHPQGEFIYLVESYWENDTPYHHFGISGCSALRMLLWQVYDWETVAAEVGVESKFGSLHPVDALKRFGASVMPSRSVFSLYRRRYMSGDQFFADDNGQHRSLDLLAYPLFVAEYKE